MPDKPRLSKAQLKRLAERHEKVVAKVLASESIALQVLSVPVHTATARLIQYIAGADDPATVKRAMYGGVHVMAPALKDEFATAAIEARTRARGLSRLQAEQDLEEFKAEAVELGLTDLASVSRVIIPERVLTAEMDNALAAHAGGSMAQKWSSTVLGTHAKWKRSEGDAGELGAALRGTGKLLEARVYDHAVAHSIDPYADEHRSAWQQAVQRIRPVESVPYPIVRDADMLPSGPDDGLPYGWGEGLFDVWSAVLDRKTCPFCGQLDGQMVPIGKGWPGADRPPLHPPRCRCVAMAVFVPEAVSKKLPGIQLDYSAMKADVADYMQGAGPDLGAGRRHAAAFVQEALSGRSSVVLTGRLSDPGAYFRAPKKAAQGKR